MTKIIAKIFRLFRSCHSKDSLPIGLTQSTESSDSKSTPPQPLTELERDLEKFKETYKFPYNSDQIEVNNIRQGLLQKYRDEALSFLQLRLKAQQGATSHLEALQNIKDACKDVSRTFPLEWVIPTQPTQIGSKHKYELIKHVIEIDDDGSYEINQKSPLAVFLSKPHA